MILHDFKTLNQQAKGFGFYWADIFAILKQIDNECQEVIDDLYDPIQLKEELGDLFHAILCGINFLELGMIDTLNGYISQFDVEEVTVCTRPNIQLLEAIKAYVQSM